MDLSCSSFLEQNEDGEQGGEWKENVEENEGIMEEIVEENEGGMENVEENEGIEEENCVMG